MICRICGKYSAHTSDIDLRKFVVDNVSYMIPVCVNDNPKDPRFLPHPDAQTKIEEIVRSEIAKRKAEEIAINQKAKEVLAQEEADKKANQERANRDNEERSYKIAMRNFQELTQGNARAKKEIYRMLKEAFEGAEDGNKQ